MKHIEKKQIDRPHPYLSILTLAGPREPTIACVQQRSVTPTTVESITTPSSPAASDATTRSSRESSVSSVSDASDDGIMLEEMPPAFWQYIAVAGSDIHWAKHQMTRFAFVRGHLDIAEQGYSYKAGQTPTTYCIRFQTRNEVAADYTDSYLAGEHEEQFKAYVDPLIEYQWESEHFAALFRLRKRAQQFKNDLERGHFGDLSEDQQEHIHTYYMLLSCLGLDKRTKYKQAEVQMILTILWSEGWIDAGEGQGDFEELGIPWKEFLKTLLVDQMKF